MAAVSLFWDTNNAVVTSCKNTLFKVIIMYKYLLHFDQINALIFHRTSFNYLLVNLAVADMTVATFLAPRYIFRHTFTHPEGVSGTVLCKVVTGGDMAWVASCASVFTLVSIATERYYSIMYPLGNKGKLTDCKLKVCLFQFLKLFFLVKKEANKQINKQIHKQKSLTRRP